MGYGVRTGLRVLGTMISTGICGKGGGGGGEFIELLPFMPLNRREPKTHVRLGLKKRIVLVFFILLLFSAEKLERGLILGASEPSVV